MDSPVLQFVADPVHVVVPVLFRPVLVALLYCVLVLVVVAKQRVHGEAVLKRHREGLVLVWKVNEDIFSRLLRQLEQVLLKFFRLRFLDALRDHDEAALEQLLLDVDRVILEVNHVEGLEGGVARTRQLDFRQNFGLKCCLTDVLVLSLHLQSALVRSQPLHVAERALQRSGLHTLVVCVREEDEGGLVAELLLFCEMGA